MAQWAGESYEDTGGFKLLPEGNYLMRVDDAVVHGEVGTSEETWKFKLTVVLGEHAGQFVYDWMRWNGKNDNHIKCFLDAVGVDTTKNLELDPTQFMAQTMMVEVVHKDNGKEGGEKRTYANVKHWDGYSPAGEEGAAQATEAAAPPPAEKRLPF